MNENVRDNKKIICRIIGFSCVFTVAEVSIEPIVRIWGLASAGAVAFSYGVGIFSMLPIIILAFYALKIKPEKFNVYTAIIAALAVMMVIVSAESEVMGRMYDASENQMMAIFARYSWKTLVTGVITAVLYIILTRTIVKQRKGENAYTKAFVVTAFVLIGIGQIFSIVTANYADASFIRVAWGFFNRLVSVATEVLLVLSVKYIGTEEQLPEADETDAPEEIENI